MILLCLFILIIILVYIIIYSRKRTCERFHKYPHLFYINLKHRKDRLKHVTKQLENVQYPTEYIHRVEATRKKNGALGCGLSHIDALEQLHKTLKGKHDYGIIMEDDFTWKNDLQTTRKMLKEIFELKKKDWNAILLTCNGYAKKNKNEGILHQVGDCQTTTGYMIQKHYIPTLLRNFKECVNQSTNVDEHKSIHTPIHHIDQYWKRLQKDKWYVTQPILGVQAQSWSDIMSNNF